MNKPKQGEIILTSFDPVKGHEQSGYRPALVVSNSDFNNASNLIWICPITNTNRRKPMDIPLKGTKTTGFVLCEHIRAVDLLNRGYSPTGDILLEETLFQVIDIVQGAVDVLQKSL
ncbi:MAG: type II toxin-antitoxin system PemK/MazF family toxin [Defluviitaleaceae bacterium]|nr:type II toxin-antitoxin system PemK/MazF family toxin [Defluviitaleaceae bacterium]